MSRFDFSLVQEYRKGSASGYHVPSDNPRHTRTLRRTWRQLKIDAYTQQCEGPEDTGGKQLFWEQVSIHKLDRQDNSSSLSSKEGKETWKPLGLLKSHLAGTDCGLLFRKWPAAEEETRVCYFKNNNRKWNAWGGRLKVVAVVFPKDVCTCGRP